MTTAVSIDRLSKRFRIYHERPRSLKERVVRLRRTTFEEFWALRDVTIDIAHGETFGLIGANGSGKSTLLKCIAGILTPDTGSVSVDGRLASLLELGAGFHPELTGRENVYLNASILGFTRKQTEERFDSIVDFSGVEPFIDTQVKHFSSGMYVRLAFAVAIHVEPEILAVDEVLAVGDESFQRKCLDRIDALRRGGATIVVVTHSMDMIRRMCDRAAMLTDGRVAALGEPPAVIRAFRESLHGEAHLEAEAGEERGDRRVVIDEVVLAGADGSRREVFRAGEELVVRVAMSTDGIEDVMAGIAIHDARDTLLFGTNTDIEGVDLGPLSGRAEVVFRCPDLPLQDGTYEITVGVTSKDHRTVYHWQERKYHFRCERTGLRDGALALEPRIVVERTSA